MYIYYCDREKCSAGHSFGPAVRPHYLIHVVLSGKGSFRYDNRVWTLSTGDAFLIEPMKTHYYRADYEDPWEYAWIGFDGSEVESLLSFTAFAQEPVFRTDSVEHGRTILSIIDAFYTSNHNVLELLSLFLKLLAQIQDPTAANADSDNASYYEAAVQYIHDNYPYDLKIQDIANHVGIDRTYLYKIFMQKGQVSPKQYLTQFRIRAACRLLREQTHSVKEVAFSCGFKDVASFCSLFHKQMGISPKQYKAQTTEDADYFFRR